MSSVTFADVAHQSDSFNAGNPAEALVLELIDNRWFQRLRDISQTANTRLVYMFSEHSRFGHSIGVAYLAKLLLNRISEQCGLKSPITAQIAQYRSAVLAAALLHDIGHLAPGSHTAFKSWFPGQPDEHEEIGIRLISEDSSIRSTLSRYGEDIAQTVCAILNEDPKLPPWTWEIISGGGWNVDRGNWCLVDSVMAGVTYGKYNIHALTESIVIADDGHLILQENRLDAMMHFAVSRHAMYRQLYQHRVIMATDTLNAAIVKRARALDDSARYADEHMRMALAAKTPGDIALGTVFWMRESWWRYHLLKWSEGSDSILADLASRLQNRRLFKTVKVLPGDSCEELYEQARKAVTDAGFSPDYHLHVVTAADAHEGEKGRSTKVLMDDGRKLPLSDADPLFNALSRPTQNQWLVMPAEAKARLGRAR